MSNSTKASEAKKPPQTASSNVPKAVQKGKAQATVKDADKTSAASKKKKTALAKIEKPLKGQKPHKQKMVRDSFTMPEDDYAKLGLLKAKCLENGIEIKKSELLRAGLSALSKMSVATLVKALGGVERLKTGRPKVNH